MTQTCQAQPCSFFPTSPVTSGQCLLPTGTVPQPLGSPEGAARPCPAPSSGEGAAVPCFSGLAACGSRDTARPWSLPGSRGPAKPRPLGLCPGWCPARAAGTPRHSSASGPAVQAGRQAGRQAARRRRGTRARPAAPGAPAGPRGCVGRPRGRPLPASSARRRQGALCPAGSAAPRQGALPLGRLRARRDLCGDAAPGSVWGARRRAPLPGGWGPRG